MSIEITPALLSDLRQKAEDAEGIVWGYSDDVEYTVYIVTPDGGRILDGSEVDENYLAHIAAANPAVVLALINQLDWQTAQHIEEIKNCIDLQKIIDDLKKEIEDLKHRCDC